jgi:hypothetical protein
MHLQFDLGEEVHLVLYSPVDLQVALLASEALHLHQGHALYPDVCEGFSYIVKLEVLDNRSDHLHDIAPLV